jgi:hypothetical protein
MRLSWLVVLLVAVALPVAAFSARLHAPARPDTAATPAGAYTRELLVISAGAGLRFSPDGGTNWRGGQRLPDGSFYGIVADPAQAGTAYLTNGDVYMTTDGGAAWRLLPPPPGAWLGPAGVTVLAADPRGGTLFAGGAQVMAYRNPHQPASNRQRRWQVWGAGWPHGAQPTALLAVPDHGLYAVAGSRVYYAAGATATWQPIAVPAWGGASITALALGPDGETPYVAVQGRGVWSLAVHPRPLGESGLPPGTRIYALQSDPLGNDLYAATNEGLYVRHLLTASVAIAWRQVIGKAHAPIIALMSLPQGNGMLALTRDGVLYRGTRAKGQSFTWPPRQGRPLRVAGPFIAALSGAAWQGIAQAPPVPAQFRRDCLPSVGPSPDRAFDVCGPFASFYLRNGQYGVLGYPLQRAAATAGGVVTQSFTNVQLQWTPRQGVYLAPLGLRRAAGRVFPKPTPAQVANVTTPYINGYFVDPLFDPFWRQYVNPPGVGPSIFGPPISQLLYETSTDGSGRRVAVQYFTNVRLEYHPERPQGNRVLLSSLGR